VRQEENIQAPDVRDSTILLVDDNEEDVLLLQRAFRKARIMNPLFEVRDGHSAIQYLSGDGAYADRTCFPIPFLILLDLRLPKLSGFEVLAWIREQRNLDELIVVVLTASERVPDMTRAHELGANFYLVKPGSFKELVGMVKEIKDRWLKQNAATAIPAFSEASCAT